MSTTDSNNLLNTVYDKWMQKFCNMKIKDTFAAMDLLHVARDEKITTRTLNLRDKLIADHIAQKKKK